MGRSLVKLSVLVMAVPKMVTGCLRMTKVTIFALGDYKVVSVSHEKYGTLFNTRLH